VNFEKGKNPRQTGQDVDANDHLLSPEPKASDKAASQQSHW
jgi:hypothetical protein